MQSKGNSRLRKLVRPLLSHLTKPVARLRDTARIISPSPHHGLRLLLKARSEPKIQYQPDVYPFAAYLAERFSCTHAIMLGRPTANDQINFFPRFKLVGIVPSADVNSYRKQYRFATWLDVNADIAAWSKEIVKRSLVVCDLDQFNNPESVLEILKTALGQVTVCILTSKDKDLDDSGRDEFRGIRRGRWSLIDLERMLKSEGFHVEFIGWTVTDNVNYEKKTILAVIMNHANRVSETAPGDFRVVAFMAAYNEEDIIVQSIKKWTDQGINVHILENWSTDSTYELAKRFEGRLPVTVERFPKDGPSDYFDWEAMLERIEKLSSELQANWFVRRGADEVLVAPWPGVSYKDALYVLDQAGFNCVDHTIVEFHPVDDGFKMGMDHEAYFRRFDFQNLSHSNQRKAWKNSGQTISTIASAGHDVLFEGRKVYPFKFLLKHYSFRSQTHGEKKVFRERKPRWNPNERAKGWHIHYDSIQEGHRFVQSASEKPVFEEDHFNKTYLVERLSGIGAHRNNLFQKSTSRRARE